MTRVRFAALLLTAFFVGAAIARSQPATPAVDLSGTWTLDTYLSDNPEQVAAAIRIDLGQSGGNQLFGGGGGGGFGGYGGGRRGGGNPRGTPSNGRNTLTPEEQQRIDEMTAIARIPRTTMTIAQTPTSVTFTDQQGRATTLQTNGKKEKQSLDSLSIDATTRWEGPQLVTEYDLTKGRTMRCTYSLVPTTKQLMLRMAFERGPGQPGPFEVKQIYNRAP